MTRRLRMRDDLGPVLALGCLVGGILVGQRAGGDGAWFALVTGAVALVGAWVVGGRSRTLVVVIALALLGTASMQRALDGRERHMLAGAVAERERVRVGGVLAGDPDGPRFGASAFVRIDGADRIVLAKASGDEAGRLRVLAAGDRVQMDGRLEPIPAHGFDARARWRHAVAILGDVRVVEFTGSVGVLGRVANWVRELIGRGMEPLTPAHRALLAGFLLGDARAISTDVTDDFRASGLSHLLAVSGANVAFVLAVFAPLLRRCSLLSRTALAITVVVCFAAVTRFEPSVLRAAGLATVTLLATFAGRPVSPLRALAFAVIVLLLADPFLVHSIGFHLSCAASAGIALFAPGLTRRLPGPAIVRDPLAVSIAAQIGVTPVLLATFGDVPVVTPLANLLAAPAAEALGVFGLVATVVGGCIPPLGATVAPFVGALLAWVTFVAHTTAGVGGEIGTKQALALAAIALAAGIGSRFRRTGADGALPSPDDQRDAHTG